MTFWSAFALRGYGVTLWSAFALRDYGVTLFFLAKAEPWRKKVVPEGRFELPTKGL